MTKRIFKSIFLAAFCVLLASLVIITAAFTNTTARHLKIR